MLFIISIQIHNILIFQITLNNEDMDGQVLMDLEVNPFRLNCKGDVEFISMLE